LSNSEQRDSWLNSGHWTLDVDKREELIEDLMALKDAVEKEEVCSAPKEGFV